MNGILKVISFFAYIFLLLVPVNRQLLIVLSSLISGVFTLGIFPLRYHHKKIRDEMIDKGFLFSIALCIIIPLIWFILGVVILEDYDWKKLLSESALLGGIALVFATRLIESVKIGLKFKMTHLGLYIGILLLLLSINLSPGALEYLRANGLLTGVEVVLFGGLWLLPYNLETFAYGKSIR